MAPRRPTRLLEDSKKSAAYPKELLANYNDPAEKEELERREFTRKEEEEL